MKGMDSFRCPLMSCSDISTWVTTDPAPCLQTLNTYSSVECWRECLVTGISTRTHDSPSAMLMLSANICIVCLFYDVIKVDSNSISLCWIFSAGNMVRWVSKPKWVRLENEFQFTRIFGTILVSWFRKIVEQLSQTTI